MPIWFELIVMLLTAYGIGLGLGWLLWSRKLTRHEIDEGKKQE